LYIKGLPHELTVAENGREGAEVFAREWFNIVFMDMEMPVMDGYEATRRIRSWEKNNGKQETPVIALTAHTMRNDRDKCMKAGCSAMLIKPYKKEQLIKMLDTYGSRAAHADEAEEGAWHLVTVDPDMKEIIPFFMDQTKEDIRHLNDALETVDYDTLRRVGHNLKGSSPSYGFHAMAEMGLAIESAALERKDMNVLKKMVGDLERYFRNVRIEYTFLDEQTD
jgi:CheY-like chemotaxis protein